MYGCFLVSAEGAMRIEQLVQFCEYVSCRSLTAASQKLFMTPQALHISIKRLEEELDVRLVSKASHGLELTAAGKRFLGFAEAVLREYRSFSEELDAMKNEGRSLSGRLYVYSNMLFQRNALPHVIKKFSAEHPDVKLYLFESDTPKIYKEFKESLPPEGAGRLGFLQRPQARGRLSSEWLSSDNYQFRELYKGFFYACTGPKLSLSARETVKKLLKYPIVLYATSTATLADNMGGIMNPTLLLLSEWGKVDIAYSVNTMEFWRQTLLDKPCVGFIHSSLVEQHDAIIEGLHLVEIKEKLRSSLGCVCSREENEMEEVFIRYMERYFSMPGS